MKRKVPAKRPKKSPKKNIANNNTNGTKSSAAKKPSQKKYQRNKGADPERLALSKNDILEFCDRVLKKWQQDPSQNARHMPAMLAVRTGIFFSDEISLKAIWTEIISWVYQLLYENAQAQARQEGQEWAKTFSKIKNDR
ncbi:MAG: hypothetical protein ACREBB_07745 [Nitrosotalea sp.]